MQHLFDTCTIKHKLKTDTAIFAVAKYCKSIEEPFTLSSEIKKELQPPIKLEQPEYELAAKVVTYIDRYITSGHISLIDLNTDSKIKLVYNKIRQQYYGWMTRTDYCKQLIENGDLTKEEYRSPGFKYKDAGECSLIAIALLSPETNIIISEDKGVVFSHPNINIFDVFKDKGLCIVKLCEWPHYPNVFEG